jgi:hypothetical protein
MKQITVKRRGSRNITKMSLRTRDARVRLSASQPDGCYINNVYGSEWGRGGPESEPSVAEFIRSAKFCARTSPPPLPCPIPSVVL